MRMTRVYTPQKLIVGQSLTLENMPSAHLIRVLRLRAGQIVLLFNGDGHDYSAEIEIPKVEAVQVRVSAAVPVQSESPLRIWLMQGLCRGEKMDWVLEKATELGVHGIIPVDMERTEVQLDTERAAKRLEHWKRIVISACEQSGRAFVPQIDALMPLDKRLALGLPCQHAYALEPDAQSLRGQLAPDVQEILIVVGPEGGLSERDLAQLKVAGVQTAGLGPRVMRTETAGPAAIGALQMQLGDWR
jgi:16S rRNA (uracil1498-N3)-methyltransferase